MSYLVGVFSTVTKFVTKFNSTIGISADRNMLRIFMFVSRHSIFSETTDIIYEVNLNSLENEIKFYDGFKKGYSSSNAGYPLMNTISRISLDNYFH